MEYIKIKTEDIKNHLLNALTLNILHLVFCFKVNGSNNEGLGNDIV